MNEEREIKESFDILRKRAEFYAFLMNAIKIFDPLLQDKEENFSDSQNLGGGGPSAADWNNLEKY